MGITRVFLPKQSPRGPARVSRAMFARLESGEEPAGAGGAPADEEVALVSPSEYDEGGPPVPRGDGGDLATAERERREDDARTTSTSAPVVRSRGVSRAVLAAVRPGPFAALAAATVIQVCAGLTYSFGAYSENLRTTFGGSEKTVALLGTVKDAGAYFGLPGGALFDRCGPAVTLLVGACAHTLGFLGVYGVLVGKGPFAGKENGASPSLSYAAFVVFVSSQGNSLFDTAALLACMRYFPEDKAAVSGVLKAYLGLSSAVFQQVYATFVPFRPERDAGSSRENDASDRAARFVLLVAVVGGAVAVIGAPFFLVREEAFEHREHGESGDGSDGTRARGGSKTAKTRTVLTRTALSRLNRLVVALAIFVSVAAAANDPSVVGVPAPPLWVNGAFTLVIIVLLIAPFASFAAVGAFGTAKEETRGRERLVERRAEFGPTDADVGSDPLSDPLLSFPAAERSADSADEEGHASSEPTPLFVGARRVDLDLLEAFKTPEQWLLFATISSSSGAAMALVNNLDQVSAAAGSAPAIASALVSAFSVCNCLGRLIGGEVSEFAFREFGVSRILCLGSAQVAVALGLAVAAFFPTPLGVFVAVALVGGGAGRALGRAAGARRRALRRGARRRRLRLALRVPDAGVVRAVHARLRRLVRRRAREADERRIGLGERRVRKTNAAVSRGRVFPRRVSRRRGVRFRVGGGHVRARRAVRARVRALTRETGGGGSALVGALVVAIG